MGNKRLGAPSTQKGIVLLAAILVVLVATAIIVSITHGEAFSIRKTAHIQTSERASLYALALEDLARLILLDDSKNSKVDFLGEDWAKLFGTSIEGGLLTGQMKDEQAKININNLLASAESMDRFKRLCKNLNVDTIFIDALLDWMDADFSIRFPDGQEGPYETHRVANRELTDISELLLIKNMTLKIYKELLPHITALPAPTLININTMKDEVFLALGQNVDLEKYKEEREDKPFNDVASFIQRLQLTIPPNGLSASTEHFYAHGTAVQGDQSVNFNTLIHRDSNGKTTILSRSLGRV